MSISVATLALRPHLMFLGALLLAPELWAQSQNCASIGQADDEVSSTRVTECVMEEQTLAHSTRRKPTLGKAPHHIVTYDLDQYDQSLRYPAPLYLLGVEKLRPRVHMTCRKRGGRQPCLDIKGW